MVKYLLTFTLLLSSCVFHNHHYIQDNPLEEVAEGILRRYSGVDVDFSPMTPENQPKGLEVPLKRF